MKVSIVDKSVNTGGIRRSAVLPVNAIRETPRSLSSVAAVGERKANGSLEISHLETEPESLTRGFQRIGQLDEDALHPRVVTSGGSSGPALSTERDKKHISGIPERSVRLNGGRSAMWTKTEELFLEDTVQKCTRSEGKRETDWPLVEVHWLDAKKLGLVAARSRNAIKAKWRALRLRRERETIKLVEVPDRAEDTGRLALVEASEDSEDTCEPSPIKDLADPTPEEWFRVRFWRVFDRTKTNKTCPTPLRRLNPKKLKSLIPLADSLIEESLVKEGNSMLVVTNAIRAVHSVIQKGHHIERKKEKEELDQWFQKNRAKAQRLRTLASWVSQELLRRERGFDPTPSQRKILRALKKETKLSKRNLISFRVRCTERLQILNSKHQRRSEERTRINERAKGKVQKRTDSVSTDLSIERIKNYWSGIIGEHRTWDQEHSALSDWGREMRCKNSPQSPISQDALDKWFDQAMKKVRPWKATGPDGVFGFWWKSLPSCRRALYLWIRDCLVGRCNIDQWLLQGRVVLLAKKPNPSGEGDYRPVACLNTSVKCLTGVLTLVASERVASILPMEQLALRKKCWGVTHAHVLDSALHTDCYTSKQSLSSCWIDFAKAFDSIPHNYILWCLKQIGLTTRLVELYRCFLNKLKVRFERVGEAGVEKSTWLRVKNGVPQGDSLSPLLFCLAIAPISHFLNKKYASDGYRFYRRLDDMTPEINHLYYVDDLKVYAKDRESLHEIIKGIRSVTTAIGLKLNDKKCAEVHLNTAPGVNVFPSLNEGETYKYLGLEQRGTVDQKTIHERVRTKVLTLLRGITSSRLTIRQIVSKCNVEVMPAYRFVCTNQFSGMGTGIRFDSVVKSAKSLDVDIRGILHEARLIFRTCNSSRLYLTPSEMGLGLYSAVHVLEDAVVYAYCYVALKDDLMFAFDLFEHHSDRGKRTVVSDFRTIMSKYGIKFQRVQVLWTPQVRVDGKTFCSPTQAAQYITSLLQKHRTTSLLEEIESKPVGGRVFRDPAIDRSLSALWLSKGMVGKKTFRNIIGMQENQLMVRGHPGSLAKNCRLCPAALETAEHVVSVCPRFRPTLMLERHNSVARNIYWYLCKVYNLPSVHYTQRVPEIVSNERVDIWWDRYVTVPTTLTCYRPDIVVFDKIAKRIYVVEVGVCWFSRLNVTTERKYSKYAVNSTVADSSPLPYYVGPNLAGELQKMYKMLVEVIPVVVGCGGEFASSSTEWLRKLPTANMSDVRRLQERLARSAVIGSDRLIRNHLAVKQV